MSKETFWGAVRFIVAIGTIDIAVALERQRDARTARAAEFIRPAGCDGCTFNDKQKALTCKIMRKNNKINKYWGQEKLRMEAF